MKDVSSEEAVRLPSRSGCLREFQSSVPQPPQLLYI